MPMRKEKTEILEALRRKTGAGGFQSAQAGSLKERAALPMGVPPLDQALGGGLWRQGVHEIATLRPDAIGAASAFALGLMCQAQREGHCALWIQQDFAAQEGGEPYAPALALYGLDVERLLILRVPKAMDAFWAMEEALSCDGLSCVLLELAPGQEADLTTTRRLQLAARTRNVLALLLRQGESRQASAASTRWRVAALPGARDKRGGLGSAVFDLHLTRNRQGACGRWSIGWNRDEHRFFTAEPLSLPVAAFPAYRPQKAAG